MTTRVDRRTGHWYFRTKLKCADGSRPRVFGVPTDYGQPDTQAGAEEAERIAVIKMYLTTGTRVEADAGAQHQAENQRLRRLLGVVLVRELLQKIETEG